MLWGEEGGLSARHNHPVRGGFVSNFDVDVAFHVDAAFHVDVAFDVYVA